MTKSIIQSAQVANINEIANYGIAMHLCKAAPINYNEAVTSAVAAGSGCSLGRITLTLSLGLGTYSHQAGVTSGRRLTVMSQTAIPLVATDNANHLAIVSDARSALLLVTTVTSQAVTSGNTANTSSFDLEVRDPT